MNRNRCLIIICLMWMQHAFSAIDTMELALRRPYQSSDSLIWVSAIGTPYSLDRSAARQGFITGNIMDWYHQTMQLSKAQQNRFQIPAYESLRLYHPGRQLSAKSVIAYLSNGNGLLTKASVYTSKDGHSLIISPQSSVPMIVEIQTSNHDIMGIEEPGLMVLVSHHKTPNNLAPYPNLKLLSGPPEWLHKIPLKNLQPFWRMQAYKQQTILLNGPVRLKLKHRLCLEPLASKLTQDYRVSYQVDDHQTQWLDFTTSVETNQQIGVNMELLTLGREQQAYLEIPDGLHRLHLVVDRSVFIQVLEQTENDYLLPALNQPRLSVQEVRRDHQAEQQSLINSKQKARTMLRSDTQKSSAMMGAHNFKQAALKRVDYPQALKDADSLLGRHTRFRTIRPTVKQARGEQFNAYFHNKQLKPIRQPQHDGVLTSQYQSAALKRLGYAAFSPVPSKPKKNRYRLPERQVETELRLIADQRECQDRQFSIQMDQQPEQSFILRCAKDNKTYLKSLAETALQPLETQLKTTENITLSHLFSAYRKPAELIAVTINRVNLPKQVKEITIWTNDQELPPLNLAIQVREAKSYQFSEHSYLARLQEQPKADLLKLFVNELTNRPKSTSQSEQQLLNQWIPLKRYLTKLNQDYKSLVADEFPTVALAKESQIKYWKNQAHEAERQQQWIEALSAWNRIVEGSEGIMRDQAQLAQAEILSKLSEHYLAESLWRYLSLYADVDIAEQARLKLVDMYLSQHDHHSILMLEAATFIQRHDQQSLDHLMHALKQKGHNRFVLLLGLTYPKAPFELMLKAAYDLQWWKTYQGLIDQLPEKQQWFWIGLKSQKLGHYQAALEAWGKAGDKVNDWRVKLEQGLKIRDQLPFATNPKQSINDVQISKSTLGQDQHILEQYGRWSKWQQMHPGDWIWRDASQSVIDSAGTDQYYAIERDLNTSSFRATQKRPLKLRVMGPARLSFQMRMLHQQIDVKLDGWVQVKDNSQQFNYPFSNNKPIKGFELIGEGEYFPGNLVSLDYEVGDGVHDIQLSSTAAPLSVMVNQQRSEIPITVLAPFGLKTFKYALNMPGLTDDLLRKKIPKKTSRSTTVEFDHLNEASIKELSEVSDANQAEVLMMQYLALVEHQPESRKTALFFAEQLHQRYPNNKHVQSQWIRLARYSEWQTVESIVSSAGLRFIETKGWQPANPGLVIRKAMISSPQPNQHVVFGNQRLLIMMTNLKPRVIDVEALLDDLPFLTDSPSIFQYQIDSNQPEQITIARSEGWKKLKMRVPTGDHQVRFWMDEPVANQFLKLRFENPENNMLVSQERTYFVSNRSNPLQVYIHGPTTIRIDELMNEKIVSRYQQVEAGWQLLTLSPQQGQIESLLQIKQRIVTERANPPNTRKKQRLIKPVRPASIPVITTQTEESETFENRIEASLTNIQLGFGTWSIGTDSVRRNNVLEDNNSSGPIHFQQFRIDHRYFDEFNNTYYNTQAFVRAREHGSPGFGLKESVRFEPDDWPFILNLNAKLVSQQVDNEQEWMGQLKVALSQPLRFTPKTRLIPRLSWFGRYLSLRNSGKVFDDGIIKNQSLIRRVDQDLYTIYKAEHTRGLSASLLLIHEPWLDTQWTARVNTVSNEDMNFFMPDYVSTETHWKQLLGEMDLDASVRVNFYQQDNNRNNSSRRHFTKLELNWQTWVEQQNRIEISAQYNYDIDRNEHLGVLSFTYHYGEHRDYFDFKPGAINFRNIKQRLKLDGYN